MRNFTSDNIPADLRPTLRAVALAYRRTYRRTKAEGLSPPLMHQRAYEAAVAEYARALPGAAPAPRVSEMIAAAINVDPRWFWHGPDR